MLSDPSYKVNGGCICVGVLGTTFWEPKSDFEVSHYSLRYILRSKEGDDLSACQLRLQRLWANKLDYMNEAIDQFWLRIMATEKMYEYENRGISRGRERDANETKQYFMLGWKRQTRRSSRFNLFAICSEIRLFLNRRQDFRLQCDKLHFHFNANHFYLVVPRKSGISLQANLSTCRQNDATLYKIETLQPKQPNLSHSNFISSFPSRR